MQAKFDKPHWRKTVGLVLKEVDRWVKELTPDWAEKWEKRDKMKEAVFAGGADGPSSSPTAIITTITPLTGATGTFAGSFTKNLT
jgi:hypothetical protein